MKRKHFVFLIFAALLLLTGCIPSIVVQNNTNIPVRVVVFARGQNSVVSPSPGYSSYVEAGEGPYSVAVIPDAQWRTYAQTKRDYLNEQLANSDQLTGEQLLKVIQSLKEIAAQIQAYQTAAAQTGGACSGTITQDGGGTVTITVGADGALIASCK